MRSNSRTVYSTLIALMVLAFLTHFSPTGAFLQTKTAFAQSGPELLTTDSDNDGLIESAALHFSNASSLGGGLGDNCGYSNFGYLSCPVGSDTCEIPLCLVPPDHVGSDVYLWMWAFDMGGSFIYDCKTIRVDDSLLCAGVTGRVVDADTGAGLPGNQPPFASVALEQCFDYGSWGYCYPRIYTQTDSQGYFRFQGYSDGNYRIRVSADPFLYGQPVLSPSGPTGYESVPITSGTSYDFGVIPIAPLIPVDSISGLVVDEVTGHPLSGTVEPFARVQLYRWGQFGWEYIADIPTSENGSYMFSSAVVGRPLFRGDYMVTGYASQYQTISNSVDVVNVQAHEARVAPVLTLLSNPVRITDVKPCENIPALGGNCDFSYRVTAGTAGFTEGVAWSLVKARGTGGFVNGTDFQACEQPLTLIPGTRAATGQVRCRFTVPASVPHYAYFCTDARFGEGSRANPHFTVQGLIDPLFCVMKLPDQGGFQVLPQREAVELMRRQKGDRR